MWICHFWSLCSSLSILCTLISFFKISNPFCLLFLCPARHVLALFSRVFFSHLWYFLFGFPFAIDFTFFFLCQIIFHPILFLAMSPPNFSISALKSCFYGGDHFTIIIFVFLSDFSSAVGQELSCTSVFNCFYFSYCLYPFFSSSL